MYWLSSNMFSLGQVACLRIPAVRTVLKIPQRVVHDADKLPPREGFIKSFKRGRGLSSVHRTRGERPRSGNRANCLPPFTQAGRVPKWHIGCGSGSDARRIAWSWRPGVNNPVQAKFCHLFLPFLCSSRLVFSSSPRSLTTDLYPQPSATAWKGWTSQHPQ